VLELDVTQPASIAAAKDIIKERTGGKLNVLVNNA
jgi:NAD(P)-dependent dehydrogenase (short-subunit alcohol dehydrogenase family)